MDASITRRLSTGIDTTRQLDRRLHNALPDLDALRMQIDDRLKSARRSLAHLLTLNAERVQGIRLRLDSLSPRDTLRRGYAIVQRKDDGSVIGASGEVAIGDDIDITLTDGELEAKITSTRQALQEQI